MIKAIVCEGEYDFLKTNKTYIETIEKLEKSDGQYLVGIDLPNKGCNDLPVLTYVRIDNDGNLTIEGSEILK